MTELEDFKSFARKVYGTELTDTQLKMYEAVKEKRTLYLPRKAGITFFNRMWRQFNKRIESKLTNGEVE